MRNRPIGSSDERPVPSFEMSGPTERSSQSWARAPRSTPAAPRPMSPRNTRLPTGEPVGRSVTSAAAPMSGRSAAVRSSSTTPRLRSGRPDGSSGGSSCQHPGNPGELCGTKGETGYGKRGDGRMATSATELGIPGFGGDQLRSGDDGYDEARAVFN